MHRPAPIAIALTVALLLLALTAPAAGATTEAAAGNGITPGQAFTARVNGAFSNAKVTVFCAGAQHIGQKGHPLGGQRLDVLSPLPPVAAGVKISVGQTGTRGRAIVARFAEDLSVPTVFHQYFGNQAIPATLLLPCSGTGTITFSPTPASPSARPSVVTVSYVNLAALPVAM